VVQWRQEFYLSALTHKTKEGQLVSRIVPTFDPGTCVSVSRHLVDYIVTEYGVRKMKAQNQWVRTEGSLKLLIRISAMN
jgi:acyl-CoA hydrolase